MIYKGYEAIVEYDEEAKILHGEVLHLIDVITFQADCVADIEQAFHDSVDDYLEFCELHHRNPEKSYSGEVIVRMKPELHRRITSSARKKKESVNKYIIHALEEYATKG